MALAGGAAVMEEFVRRKRMEVLLALRGKIFIEYDWEREEELELKAAEEGEEPLVNAMYHRSYEIREPVEVRIHPDRIQILSFPGPDSSVRREDIATGNIVSRRYRNRRIGEFLKELELTEGKATGIPRIKKAMRTNGSPEPVFNTDDERTYFLTVLPVHTDFLSELPAEMINVPVNVPVNERQQWFLEQLLAGKQVKAADIVAHWEVTEKSAKRDIADLKARGAIEFVGAPKKGFYRVKS